MVSALTSCQCDLGSSPGVEITCGSSLLMVLSHAPRGFSLDTEELLSATWVNKIINYNYQYSYSFQPIDDLCGLK